MTDDVARQATGRALSAGGLMLCALLGQAKRYAGCPWVSHVVAAVDAEPPSLRVMSFVRLGGAPDRSSTAESEESSPEPSPAISYLGKTKIVTLGDVEIRATRNEIGINVACNVTNTTDVDRNIKVRVSVGDGKNWVTTNNFEFQQVPAGKSASESTVMGASFAGTLPDDPKVYIDSVTHY
ncbi:hypothetical protein ACWGI0_07030 [Streptomyces sp. NPDC054802]